MTSHAGYGIASCLSADYSTTRLPNHQVRASLGTVAHLRSVAAQCGGGVLLFVTRAHLCASEPLWSPAAALPSRDAASALAVPRLAHLQGG